MPFALARLGTWITALIIAGCGAGSGQGLDANGRPADAAGTTGPLVASFESIQANVFTPICVSCHAGSQAPLGLRLDEGASYALLVNVPSEQEPGLLRVAPGDPDNSYLVQKIQGTAASGARMPLGLPPLPQSTIDVIRSWIAAGALPATDPGPALPPSIVAMTPDAGSVSTSLPTAIQVIFSAPLDASLLSDTTVNLIRAGGDGGFADGNEIALVANAITLSPDNAAILRIDLTGVVSVDDDYQLTLVGSGATALAGVDGQVIDGDDDGAAGGDFVARFAVSSIAPTLESIQANVFTPSCALSGCHSGPAGPDLPEGQDLSSAARSFASLVGVASVEVPTLQRVNPGNAAESYLIQKLEGVAAVGARMPLGGDPLPWPTIDVIAAWIDAGAPFDGEPADITPPSVSLSAPPSPARGVVTLSAAAADNVGVSEVAFVIDGATVATVAAAPYTADWDSTTVTDGEHVLLARASDAAGNIGESASVTFSVDNSPPDMTPPSVELTAPVATTVGGLVTIAAQASDDVAVAEVRFLVDGLQLAIDTVAPYAQDWDTTLFSDGMHTLQAEALDTSGNAASSPPLTVTVANAPTGDTTPPNVTLTAPAAGVVNGTIAVQAEASDDVGVTEVRFFADVDFIGADATAPYSVNWDTTLGSDGERQLTAEAADAAGNTGFSDPVTVTVDNTAPSVTSIAPAPGAVLSALPASIDIAFSEAMTTSGIDTVSFTLQASGGDGTFGDGNETTLVPVGVSTPSASTAVMDLAGVPGGDDTYRVRLADTISDANGIALDGDGDTIAGGDFVVTFSVSSAPGYTTDVQPIFVAKCAPCHTGLGFGGHDIGTTYADAFLPAGNSDCDGLNVGQCTIVRIRSGDMPRGAGCSGDPATDAGNPDCLTQEEQDTVQAWIDAGLPE